jgi:spore germination cell wall hydrolase CwlJ-like protein
MIWRRLGIFIDALWTDLMLELERNPLAVRQGAVAVACVAAAAIAMPVISHRAAEQREGAEWSARSLSFETHMQAQLIPGYDAPGAHVALASYAARTGDIAMLDDGGRPQASLVRAALRGPFDAPAAAVDPAADVTLDQTQLRCMAEAIYYEARGENVRGQVAVGEVIMNRVHSRYYPRTICGVVYQGRERVTGCQFTFTCDGSLNRRPGGRAWSRAQHIAAQVMQGHTRSVVGASTHYHTTAVSPAWRPMLVETLRLGDHVFYRLPTRAERAVLQASAPRRRAPRADLPIDDAQDPPVEPAPTSADATPTPAAPVAAPEAAPPAAIEVAA